MQDGLALLERAAERNRPKTGLELLESAAADNAPLVDRLKQTASSFVEGAVTAADTIGSGIIRGLGMKPVTDEERKRGQEAFSIPGVQGQGEKFYAKVAGVAGQSATLAPLALAGPTALAASGAAIGAEQGIEDAQAHGASTTDTVYSALGNAFLGAATSMGPLKALSRFGVNPAAHSVVLNALEAAGVGTSQTLGADVIAKATYDPTRVIDIGKAVEAGLAMGVAGAGTSGGVKLLEIAAGQRATRAGERPQAPASGGEPVSPELTSVSPKLTDPIPGMPEPAPTVDLTGGGESMAVQEAQPGPGSPVSPGMSGGEVALETKPVEGQAIPVSDAPTAASDVVEPSPPAPAVSFPEDTAGVSRFTNDHIDTIGRGENKMELVARDASGKPIGVAEYTQVGDQVNIDMVTVREDMRRQGIGKRLIEEVQRANPQATVNLGMAVSEAGEALRKSSERDLSNTYQTTAPSPETKTAAPVEALKKDEGAVSPTPEQAAQGEDANTIALRHETTAAKRAERDFPEYERTPSRKDEDLKRQAIESLTSDPFAGRKLVEKVAAGHIPDDVESFLLLAEANRLRNELKLADVEAIKDPSEANKALVDSLSAEFNKAMDATDAAGTQQGRSFRVRAQQMREDYSLAGVVRKKAKALGRSLNEAEMEHAREVTRKLDELEKRVTEAETRQDTIEADRIAQEKVETLKREVRARPRTDRIQRNKERMAEIVRSFATMRASANEFANPENYKRLVEFAKLAIENGALKVADLYVHAKDLLDQFGDEVRPHLTKAWDDAVKEHHDELVKPVRERFAAGEKPGRALDTLALHLVEQGITERDALIDALHKAVPGATKEQLRDALSRYGQFKQASQEESHKTLRQLKQEMQKVAQIEALEKRIAPLKTGFDRGDPSDEYRRLSKRVEQIKKETGIRPPVDPERALKSAEASRETYLRNRITDLRDEIATGKREARQRGEHPTNPTIAALEAELSIVQDEHASTFKKPSKTPEEKSAARDKDRIAAIERTAKHYEKMVENWDVGTKEKPKPIDSPEYRAAVAHRDAARAVVEELRALANPKATPEERATKAALTRLANEAAAIQQRITFKEFGPKEPKVARTPSSQEITARAERDRLKRQFELENFRAERERRTKFQKVRDAAVDVVFNVPKSIFSSFDFSAVGRQGFPFTVQDLAMRQPALLARMGRMFRAFGSEAYADRVQASIEAHPNFEMSKKAGLELTGYGDGLTRHEEIFRSSLASKIPGVKASERAYVTYLNLLRFDHFQRILANTDGSPEAAKSVARLVNEATGRGQVGKRGFARAVDASGKVLWAPRLYVSRFQLIYGDPIIRGKGARAAIVREYATTLAATAAIYSLVALYNATNPDDEATVSLDPTSPDGGKIKIGNTRIDPLAGLQQATRLIAREGRSIGQSVQGEKPKEDAVDIALTFLRTKVSPSVAVPYELVTGKDIAFGREVDRASVLVPFAFQDIYQAMQDQGVPKGTALGILSLFGVGLNTYQDKKKSAALPVANK